MLEIDLRKDSGYDGIHEPRLGSVWFGIWSVKARTKSWVNYAIRRLQISVVRYFRTTDFPLLYASSSSRSNSVQESSPFFVFYFSDRDASLSWYAFRETGGKALTLQELWEGKEYAVGADEEYLVIQPFRFLVFGEG